MKHSESFGASHGKEGDIFSILEEFICRDESRKPVSGELSLLLHVILVTCTSLIASLTGLHGMGFNDVQITRAYGGNGN